jgi:hypothetical protein
VGAAAGAAQEREAALNTAHDPAKTARLK